MTRQTVEETEKGREEGEQSVKGRCGWRAARMWAASPTLGPHWAGRQEEPRASERNGDKEGPRDWHKGKERGRRSKRTR